MSNLSSINIKAILMGLLVKFGGGFVWGLISGLIYSIILLNQGVSPEQIESSLYSNNFLTVALIVGSLLNIASGFVTAKIAKVEVYKNVILMTVLSLFFGLSLFLFIDSLSHLPSWYIYIGYSAGIPLTILGGYLYKQKYGEL